MNDKKQELTEENWNEIVDFSEDLLDSFDGKPTYQVVHALELLYAYLGVTTNIHIHAMLNNIMAHYKNSRKELESE